MVFVLFSVPRFPTFISYTSPGVTVTSLIYARPPPPPPVPATQPPPPPPAYGVMPPQQQYQQQHQWNSSSAGAGGTGETAGWDPNSYYGTNYGADASGGAGGFNWWENSSGD